MPILKKVFTAVLCYVFVVTYSNAEVGFSQSQAAPAPAAAASDQPAPKIPNDQLDSLVAPIALYPDPLLSQVLVASTYPLEIIQLQQYLEKNPTLKGKALTDAVSKQNWDPSIQAMAALPDAVKRLADDITWTTDLGNAFLAQQSDVMDSVQRMRKKAEGTGALKTTPQQTVETQTVENKQVIVVQPASTEVVYVPSYNPVVVYGPPVYAYPPIYYPPPPPVGAIVAASMISFGVGLAIGAAWGGGWGWGCGWGHSNININVNNTFIHNSNINRHTNIGGNGGTWQHDPAHRGGAPYANRQTANRFGGTTANSSLASRQNNARQQIGQGGGSRLGVGGSGTRQGQFGQGASRPGGGGAGTARAGQGDFGGANRIGDRSISQGRGTGRGSAWGGGGGGFNGASARASSARGASSMSRGGGGGMRGGGRRR